MTLLNHNITRMIGSYPTSFNRLNNYESKIQEEVARLVNETLTIDEQINLSTMLRDHDNDYFVKAFRKQFSLKDAADVSLGEVIYFAVKVCKSVAS